MGSLTPGVVLLGVLPAMEVMGTRSQEQATQP
jgi:hypothetical protein